jgi:hypothetical protein
MIYMDSGTEGGEANCTKYTAEIAEVMEKTTSV